VQRLGDADPALADMRTLVLIGSSALRVIDRPDGTCFVYAPRGSKRAS
jgi:precorrin-3B C17-methyltransferase